MVAVALPHPAANASPSVPDAEPTAPTAMVGAVLVLSAFQLPIREVLTFG